MVEFKSKLYATTIVRALTAADNTYYDLEYDLTDDNNDTKEYGVRGNPFNTCKNKHAYKSHGNSEGKRLDKNVQTDYQRHRPTNLLQPKVQGSGQAKAVHLRTDNASDQS